MSDSHTRYLFEYRYEGAEWALELRARDLNDAKARLQTLPFAQFRGEIVASGLLPVSEPPHANRPPTQLQYQVVVNDN